MKSQVLQYYISYDIYARNEGDEIVETNKGSFRVVPLVMFLSIFSNREFVEREIEVECRA